MTLLHPTQTAELYGSIFALSILAQRLGQFVLQFCKQELSYRKQIARQLHTEYVEGIYRPNYSTQ